MQLLGCCCITPASAETSCPVATYRKPNCSHSLLPDVHQLIVCQSKQLRAVCLPYARLCDQAIEKECLGELEPFAGSGQLT